MNVLDLSRGVAGAFCAQMLALSGAAVTRIALIHDALVDVPALSGLNAELLALGTRQERLDLGDAAQRQRLLDLVATAEVVVEDLGAGRLEACGLTPLLLHDRRPGLVLTRISAFGQSGPHAERAGSELIALATGGLLFLTGPHDRPPVQLAPLQAQRTTGLLAAIATLAALAREDQAEPVTIDCSQQEAVASLVTPALSEFAYTGVIPAREGTVAGMTRIEPARDTWVYAGPAAPGNANYQRFADFLGVPELADERFATAESRMEHWAEHQALVLPKLRERTAQAWVDAAEAWHLTFGRVQTTLDLLASDVLAERDFFTTAETAAGTARVAKAPYLVDGVRPSLPQEPEP